MTRHHSSPELVRLRAAVLADPIPDGPRLAYAAGCAALGMTGRARKIRNMLKNPKATDTKVLARYVMGTGKEVVSAAVIRRRGFIDAAYGTWTVLRGYLPQILSQNPATVKLWTFPYAPGYSTVEVMAASGYPYPVQTGRRTWILEPPPDVHLVSITRPSTRSARSMTIERYKSHTDVLRGSLSSCLVPHDLYDFWPKHHLLSCNSDMPLGVQDTLELYAPSVEVSWPVFAWTYPNQLEADAAFQTAVRAYAMANLKPRGGPR